MAMNLGEATARITLDASQLMSESSRAQSALNQLDGTVGKTGGGFDRFKNSMLGIGTALITPMAIGLKGAVDLEQAMANLNATLGGLDASSLDGLEQGFLDIGAASQFSAIEVAAVGDAIAKAGFGAEEIVGMTEAVVNLSQATGTDLSTSVSGITAAMNTWNESIVGTDLALTDASRAADIFTVAANQSSADVDDIIAGMRSLGPAAASIGIGFDESAASIALFTNYGLKAADSGVSMTRAIENLLNPTAEAQAEMERLGISAFDMNGNFVGLPALFDQLQGSMKDMTPEARSMALSTIFGAEAIDVMTIAALTGGDPLRTIMELMGETGVAAEQSAARMDTLGAQFGELWEGVRNLLISLVSGLIPGMRILVDAANAVVDVLSRIPGPIKTIVGAFAGLLAGIAAVVRGFQAFSAVNALLGGGGLLGGLSFGAIAVPLLALAAAIGGVYAAIRFNLFGIGDAFNKFISIWNNLADSVAGDPVSRFLIALGQALQTFDVALLDSIGRKLNDLGKDINDFVGGFKDAWELVFGDDAQDVIDDFNGKIDESLEPMDKVQQAMGLNVDLAKHYAGATGEATTQTDALRRAAGEAQFPITAIGRGFFVVGEAFRRAGYDRMADTFTDIGFAVDDLLTSFRAFRDQGVGPISSALLALGVVLPGLERAMLGLAGVTTNLGDAFQAAIQGDWSQAFEDLRAAANGAWIVIQEGLSFLGDLGVQLGNVAVNVADWVIGQIPDVWAWLRDTAIPAIGDAAVWLYGAIVNIGSWARGVVQERIWPFLRGWIDELISTAGDVASAVSGVIVNIASWARGTAPRIWTFLRGWIDELLNTAGDVASSIAGVVVNIASWARGTAPRLWVFLRGWIDALLATAGDVASAVNDVRVNIQSWAQGEIDDISDDIEGWIVNPVATITSVTASIEGWIVSDTNEDDLETKIELAVGTVAVESVDASLGTVEWAVTSVSVEELSAAIFLAAAGAVVIATLPVTVPVALTLGAIIGLVALGAFLARSVFVWAQENPLDAIETIVDVTVTLGNIVDHLTGGRGLTEFALTLIGLPRDGFIRTTAQSIINWVVEKGSVEDLLTGGLGWKEFAFSLIGLPEDGIVRVTAGIVVNWVFGGDEEIEVAAAAGSPVFNYDDDIILNATGDMVLTGPDGKPINPDDVNIEDLVAADTDFTLPGLQFQPGDDYQWTPAADFQEGLAGRIRNDAAGMPPVEIAVPLNMNFGTPGGLGAGVGGGFGALQAQVETALTGVTTSIQTKASEWGTAITGTGPALAAGASAAFLGMQTAISLNMLTIGTTIQTAAASWALNLQTGLTMMTAAVSTAFMALQLAIGFSLFAIALQIQTAAAGWALTVSAQGTAMAAAASTATAAMLTAIQTGFQTATTAVTTHAQAWAVIVAAQGAAMAASAAAAAESVRASLADGMQAATTAVTTHASAWPAIISSFEGAMYVAGLGVGIQAGQGVADGIRSMVGVVQAAANEIIAAAAGAMAAAAIISSPSKLTRYYGEMMGAGLVLGLDSMQPRVAASSASLMTTASPYLPSAAPMYGGGGTSVHAPVSVNATIHTQGRLDDADKRALANDFAVALRDGIDIEYMSHGVTQ